MLCILFVAVCKVIVELTWSFTLRYLALLCIMRKESFDKRGLVDYNIQVFQRALEKVFELQR